MASEEDVAGLVSFISAAYPNFKVSEMTVEVYYQFLKDIPADELKAAVLSAVGEPGRQFAPSVGEIRGAVMGLRRFVNDVPTSFQAWREVQEQILINGGDYGHPVWSHPLVEQTVRAMGWRHLRMSEDSVADRARFVQAYDQLQSRYESEEVMIPEVRGYIAQTQAGVRMLVDKWNVRNDETLPYPVDARGSDE